jgi:hypothetical protein
MLSQPVETIGDVIKLKKTGKQWCRRIAQKCRFILSLHFIASFYRFLSLFVAFLSLFVAFLSLFVAWQ